MSDDPTHVREFFGARAAGWDSRFPDDGPAYAAAVNELGLRPGDTVLDAGCGTGRALPPLRGAVGPTGTVLGADLTPEMLERATAAGRGGSDGTAALLLTDVGRLPVRDGALDAVFGAGLVSHLADPVAACVNSPVSSVPGAGSRSSTRSAAPRSRPATAGRSPRRTSAPSPGCARCSPRPAGGSSATSTRTRATWPSPYGRAESRTVPKRRRACRYGIRPTCLSTSTSG